jgi:hypothetical protein
LEGADSLGLLPPFAHLTPAILGPKNDVYALHVLWSIHFP